jgi:hypothetical protein
MIKVGGGLLKLDAICAKLKTNLKTKQASDSDDVFTDQLPSGVSDCTNTIGNDAEPNNNTDALDLIKDRTPVTNNEDSGHGNDHGNGEVDDEIEQSGSPHPASSGNDYLSQQVAVGRAADEFTELTPEGSRKSRRKAKRPRSIANIAAEQAKEELSEYEENNPDVDFDSMCEAAMEEEDDDDRLIIYGDDDENETRDSYSRMLADSDEDNHMSYQENDTSHDQQHTEPFGGQTADQTRSVDCNDNDCGVLDLRVTRQINVFRHINDNEEEDDEESDDDDDIPEENGVLNLSVTPRKTISNAGGAKPNLPPKSSNDEAEMKDYAENTMNELLSMYGLGGEGETISSRIPLKNFDSGSILGRSPICMMKGAATHRGSPLAAIKGQRLYNQAIVAKKMKMDFEDDEDDDDDLLAGSPGQYNTMLHSANYLINCIPVRMYTVGLVVVLLPCP